MRAIHRKMLRELWQMRWQCLAIVLVMASGVAIVVMTVSTLQSLLDTRAQFYEQSRFGQVFVHLKRAPLSIADRLREVPGVAAVEARVAQNVTLDVAGLTEPATGRILSVPDQGEPAVSRLHLRKGRYLQPRRSGEVLVSEAFATAHGLEPGDSLSAIINGKQKKLLIAGVVLSPEYVYSVRPGELLPDDKRFGVLWMGYDELASAFDLDGAFNDVSLTLLRGASEAAVLDQVDALLARHGGTDAYGRDQQPSHRFLENELIQLRTMAFVPPLIFLGVTIFLLHVVMSRLVALQREQIATMRAFGYTRFEIALHFFTFTLIIGLAGTVAGIALGAKFGSDLTTLYTHFFRFPELHYYLDWRIALATALASIAAALGGVMHAVLRAAKLPPAQAMQPEAPPSYRASMAERIGLQRFLSPVARMILRQLERHPTRALLSSLGIAFSVGLLVMGNFLEDTVDHVLGFQFFVVQRHDMMVAFVEPSSYQAARDLVAMPGVQAVEPFRAAPVRLVHHQHERRLELLGLDADAQLMRVVDPVQGTVRLPEEGLVISRRLAEVLGCRPGDRVRIHVLEGRRPIQDVPVTSVVDDYLDLNAYMNAKALRRILGEQDTVSGAFLRVDQLQSNHLYRELKRTPRIAGVSIKRAAIDSYEKTMAENLLRMKVINVAFAAIVALGVVYNCARISLAERSRDLATLRVLGFTRTEVSTVLLGELLVLVLAAIPLGLVVGYALAWLLTINLDTEVHRFPLIIHSRTYALAVMVTVISAIVSALVVRRRMDHFNLIEVLKARD